MGEWVLALALWLLVLGGIGGAIVRWMKA